MSKEKMTKNAGCEDNSFRQLTMDELREQLLVFSKDQFKLRMQKGAGETIKPHLVKRVRRSIARIKTELTAKNKLQLNGV